MRLPAIAPSTPRESADPGGRPAEWTAAWIATWLAVCLGLAYGFDIGRGFMSDDFGWIAFNRDLAAGGIRRLFVETPMGFYRPFVSVSFFVNHVMFGANAAGYALTNVALVAAIGAGIVWLGRAFGLGAAAGIFGAGIWAFNVHGIGMSLTWISGRTSLLATLFAVLAAIATTKGRAVGAGACTLAALLSKEEPIMLPIVLAGWAAIDRWSEGGGARPAVAAGWRAAWPSFLALGLYLGLRLQSTAMTPGTAPAYYALSVSPGVIVPNVLSYIDRAGTVAVSVLLLGVLGFARRRPRLDADERRVVFKGATWTVLGFVPTVLVPVRSDLYAMYPSIGVALIAVGAGAAVWRAIPHTRRRAAVAAALLLPLALVPVYRARNAANRANAVLSSRLLAHITQVLAARDDISRVEVFQTEGERPSAAAALGGALPVAIEWRTGRHVTTDIHLLGAAALSEAPGPGTVHVRIDRGNIVSVAGPR